MTAHRFSRCVLAAAAAGLLGSGLALATSAENGAPAGGMLKRDDFEIVDCLLPGQLRQLGNMTYLTQRRPVRTTATDCRIRGGEYVAFDRANLQTALRVWMAAATAGDPQAETNVGEMYERGMGVPPDYQMAASWYSKAAAKKYPRALFDLGSLYDQGLGVPQDKLKALDLYRQSWGLPADSVIYESAAREEQDQLRTELQQQLEEKDAQVKLLQSQLDALQKQLQQQRGAAQASATSTSQLQAQIKTMRGLIAQLTDERKASSDQLASLPQLRMPTATRAGILQAPQADPRAYAGLDFGRYYALIIGNQHYQLIDSLQTPISDADRIAELLRDRYGFTVQVMTDANDVAMLKALNDLDETLKPNDNLLIYYAGHGVRLRNDVTEVGYWLPVNSEPPPRDTFWIQNEQITAHLARLPARRILVIADSCYSGLLSTDPSYLFLGDGGYSRQYIRLKLPRRSRLLISSGGDNPVLDSGGDGDSVFAHALLEVLQSNQGLLSAPQLFGRLRERVQAEAKTNNFTETPEFKTIREAGHEMGDFFFLPVTASASVAANR